MICRIGYTLWMAWRHRKMLSSYRRQKSLQSESITKCDLQSWKKAGIQGVVIDVDGVLTSYGELELSKEVGSWLNSCIALFGKERIFILTNKPTKARIAYFSEYFSGITVILPKRKKPYPDGIQEILKRSALQSKALLVIDDRLLTGILAAIIANTAACYITKPLISWRKQPIPEFFFLILRKIERFFV